MTAQKLATQIRLQEWARQIEERERSGASVREWCEENGVGIKNYYYRKRRVREEYINAVGVGTALALSRNSLAESKPAIFAEIPLTHIANVQEVAATVHIGTYRAEINNGADINTIDGLLRTLSRL